MPTVILPTASVGPVLGEDVHAGLTCPVGWSVSDCFLNVVELSEALQSEDPVSLASSLTRFLNQLSLPVNTYPTAERALEDYLSLSPRLNRLFAIWEHARESQDRSLYVAFDVLSLLIRRLPHLPAIAGETILELMTYLIQELDLTTFLHPALSAGGRTSILSMRFLHFLISLPTSEFGLSIGIRGGPRVVRAILSKLDQKYLHRHASSTTRKDPPKLATCKSERKDSPGGFLFFLNDVYYIQASSTHRAFFPFPLALRYVYIETLITCLDLADEDTKLEWLSDKTFLSPLWRPLSKDTPEVSGAFPWISRT